MRSWLNRHLQLLCRTEAWFNEIHARLEHQMQCGRGCALCCHGLFDISFADAFLLAEAFGRLESGQREAARARAVGIHTAISRTAPDLKAPYLLDRTPETLIDTIVLAADSPRCPLLGQNDECLVYRFRPLACRLEGLPMVDAKDGIFGDWCELNFRNGVPKEDLPFLARDYYALQAEEDTSTEVMADLLLGRRDRDITVFIPSVITEFELFWQGLLARLDRADA